MEASACNRPPWSAGFPASARGSSSSTSVPQGRRWICCNRVQERRTRCGSRRAPRHDERALSERLSDTTFSSVDVDRRVARQTALATDPLAVVTLLILTASALVSLLLGACAVMFGAAADVGDDRPLLRVLALERVRGRRLVAMVAGKSVAAVLIAIPLGVIGGRWLLQIATRSGRRVGDFDPAESAAATGSAVGRRPVAIGRARLCPRARRGARRDTSTACSR